MKQSVLDLYYYLNSYKTNEHDYARNYEKLFLKATPSTKNESVIDPYVTCLIPIKSLSLNHSSFSIASTIIFEKNFL